MLKTSNKKFIEDGDWDKLVVETYKRPYHLQQQNDCQPRGVVSLTIPDEAWEEEEMHDEIPEVVNGSIMGVKFEKWLGRDPKKPIPNQTQNYQLGLFWDRNFYPSLQTVANDLYKKGLIEAGEYAINIDW